MGRKTYEQVLEFRPTVRETNGAAPDNKPPALASISRICSRNVGVSVVLPKGGTEEDLWLVGGSQLIKVFLKKTLCRI